MKERISRSLRTLRRVVHVLLMLVGLAAVLVAVLAFTPYPWRMYRWLATDSYVPTGPPEYIVVLGGGGIPSESGLVRTYHAAAAGQEFFRARMIVALPADEGEGLLSSPEKMKKELVMRGIMRGRIMFEDRGRNTREQALRVRAMIGEGDHEPSVLLVTCPEHMRRALLSFRKAGFTRVAGNPAFSESVEADLSYDGKDLGGRQARLLEIAEREALRYHFWNNVHYMAQSGRELVALTYYRVRGWI